MNYKKHINKNGQISVLHSNSYGRPWTSTQNNKSVEEVLLFDKNLIEMVLNKDSVTNAINYLNGKGIYLLKENSPEMEAFLLKECWNSLTITAIEPGTAFSISCYDGIESVLTNSNSTTFIA